MLSMALQLSGVLAMVLSEWINAARACELLGEG
jgi:hypothetical protein